jgi:alkyldihydroxyacetonephosphate synthase
VLGRVEQLFGPAERIVKPPRLEDIALAPPWLDPPPSLPFCSTVSVTAWAHTYGKSFPDYVRGLVGEGPPLRIVP